MSDVEPAGVAVSTRLMNALQAAHELGGLTYLGGDRYTVRVERSKGDQQWSVVRSGTTEQMWAWLNGLHLGAHLPDRIEGTAWVNGWWSDDVDAAVARLVQVRDDTAAFRRLVVSPTLVDAVRIQVLAGMEEKGWDSQDMAERIDRAGDSVRLALRFGESPPRVGNLGIFDLMLRALGSPVNIEFNPVPGGDVVQAASGARREPSGVTRMRALVIAAERRLIDGVSPTGVQKARRTREFKIRVAGHEVVRPRQTVIHWLRGLADGSCDQRAMIALNLT